MPEVRVVGGAHGVVPAHHQGESLDVFGEVAVQHLQIRRPVFLRLPARQEHTGRVELRADDVDRRGLQGLQEGRGVADVHERPIAEDPMGVVGEAQVLVCVGEHRDVFPVEKLRQIFSHLLRRVDG